MRYACFTHEQLSVGVLSPADRRLLKQVLAGHALVEIARREGLTRHATRCWVRQVMAEVRDAGAVRNAARPGTTQAPQR